MPEPFPFLGSSFKTENPDVTILGLPYDQHKSGRGGADKAPDAIRIASDLIETYSPYLNRDLENLKILDKGDLDINGNFPLQKIQAAARGLFQSGSLPVFIGGNHSVSLPIVQAAKTVFPDLHILILDAHADLREEYLGSRENHACVTRRIAETVGFDRLKLFGVRSGLAEEFRLIGQHELRVALFEEEIDRLCRFLEKKPVYLSLDLDVFDPGIFPAAPTPEPGGITYNLFLELCQRLNGQAFVGFDVVEYSPELDYSGISAVLAASCIRELILLGALK